MSEKEIGRAIASAAYEQGWRDACDDHMLQRQNAEHAIGDGKRPDVDCVLTLIDPSNLAGLAAFTEDHL